MSPLVSCIMPTANRRDFARLAIRYFARQNYENRELIVIDDGEDPVEDLARGAERIRYIRLERRRTVGAKRNIACSCARGEVVLHWDDDDWYSPNRISAQIAALGDADACGLSRLLYYHPAANRAWEYSYPAGRRVWVAGNTLCYRKAMWERHPFPEVDVGEDSRFLWSDRAARVAICPDNTFVIGLVHPANVSPKKTDGVWWREVPSAEIEDRMGADFRVYRGSAKRRCALVTAARGIGDILRITPLVRVFSQSGYRVDVALEPDYPETVELLRGAPEIENLYWRASHWAKTAAENLAGLADQRYDTACFTAWSISLRPQVNTARHYCFDRARWLQEGDSAEVERIARAVGWSGDLPAPFALKSARRFDLEPGTIALHPGCKADWPWKKWHGFDELAAQLPEVALVGTASDLDNARTYFQRPFAWPGHVRDFIGQLSLPDTAAL